MHKNELCVPATALANTAEDGAQMSPEPGDPVEVTISGTVTRSEGGNVYLTPKSANGQPIEEKSDGESSMEREDEEMRRGLEAPGYSAMVLIAILAWLAMASAASGQQDLRLAKRLTTSGTIVSNWVVLNQVGTGPASTNAMQVFRVEIDNYTGTTHYAMVFDASTNKVANDVPGFTPRPIATGASVQFDFGPTGVPFDRGINICLSTTPRSLTNSASGGIVTVVWSPR